MLLMAKYRSGWWFASMTKKIDCKQPERKEQFCLLLSSIVLLISALTVMCIQENCLFLLDMAGTSEACEVSSTRNARGGRENISTQHRECIYTNLQSQTWQRQTQGDVLEFVSEYLSQGYFCEISLGVGGGVSLLGAQRLKPTQGLFLPFKETLNGAYFEEKFTGNELV